MRLNFLLSKFMLVYVLLLNCPFFELSFFFEIRVERFASDVSDCSLELLALELSAVVELSSPKWLLDETWPTFVSMWFFDSMSMSLEFGI